MILMTDMLHDPPFIRRILRVRFIVILCWIDLISSCVARIVRRCRHVRMHVPVHYTCLFITRADSNPASTSLSRSKNTTSTYTKYNGCEAILYASLEEPDRPVDILFSFELRAPRSRSTTIRQMMMICYIQSFFLAYGCPKNRAIADS